MPKFNPSKHCITCGKIFKKERKFQQKCRTDCTPIGSPADPYPKAMVGIIKMASKILQKDECITFSDIETLKRIISDHLNVDNLSPQQINDLYGLGYKGFHSVITRMLDMPIKSKKDAMINRSVQNGTRTTDQKKLYKLECKFDFCPYNEPQILGYELLSTYTFTKCGGPNSLHRDHMYSIADGWKNNVDPKIISHPANCQIMFSLENIKKYTKSSITLEELKEKINHWE